MNKLKPLTISQKEQLKKHKQHHTSKHMKSMTMNMMLGKSFKQAHQIAMKNVGK